MAGHARQRPGGRRARVPASPWRNGAREGPPSHGRLRASSPKGSRRASDRGRSDGRRPGRHLLCAADGPPSGPPSPPSSTRSLRPHRTAPDSACRSTPSPGRRPSGRRLRPGNAARSGSPRPDRSHPALVAPPEHQPIRSSPPLRAPPLAAPASRRSHCDRGHHRPHRDRPPPSSAAGSYRQAHLAARAAQRPFHHSIRSTL